MNKINFIIEVANTHGGSKDYVSSLLDEFAHFKGHGIKFQPLHPDRIATPDFTWYPVYQELLFSSSVWIEIIDKAALTKNVWLDLFDTYGVQILRENLSKIFGIKLQASILYNEHVIDALSHADCSALKLIINISALSFSEIKERLNYLQNKIKPQEIFLEVGFQSYPTELEDSGLIKIQHLKDQFSNPIVFADHIDGKLDDAVILPLIATLYGASYIEKHVMHSNLETKYDYFSSVNIDTYTALVSKIEAYVTLQSKSFINSKEVTYLANSIQIPIALNDIPKGKGLHLLHDLEFKRSNQGGLSVLDIRNLSEQGYILARDIKKGSTFKREDFKKVVIGVIIAGRLKSSRLKKKALLKIGEVTSVEKCIQSCLALPQVSYTVLATSTTDEDAELKNYTYAPQVIFHTGHPDDVVQRYLDIINRLDIDIVFRVTADMPYVSSEIAEVLLKEHLKSGADYTAARDCAVGTAPEVINTQALREVKKHFPNADFSEYMTWYFQNNPEHFKLNFVELPENLVRKYRFTLDYQEDLDLFIAIQKHIDDTKKPNNIETIFDFLDANPEIAGINRHIQLKYKSDKNLISLLNKETKIK
jgi:N,N'-diacetyllegionaminate synthase